MAVVSASRPLGKDSGVTRTVPRQNKPSPTSTSPMCPPAATQLPNDCFLPASVPLERRER
jgi:hypothetical protein